MLALGNGLAVQVFEGQFCHSKQTYLDKHDVPTESGFSLLATWMLSRKRQLWNLMRLSLRGAWDSVQILEFSQKGQHTKAHLRQMGTEEQAEGHRRGDIP